MYADPMHFLVWEFGFSWAEVGARKAKPTVLVLLLNPQTYMMYMVLMVKLLLAVAAPLQTRLICLSFTPYQLTSAS